jgi:hypothetical protein
MNSSEFVPIHTNIRGVPQETIEEEYNESNPESCIVMSALDSADLDELSYYQLSKLLKRLKITTKK